MKILEKILTSQTNWHYLSTYFFEMKSLSMRNHPPLIEKEAYDGKRRYVANLSLVLD